jgi:hypothetical protein
MLHVTAPRTGERALGDRACVDEQPHHPRAVLKVLTLVLEMTGCLGLLVLLLVAQALIPAWNVCAWGTRSIGSRMAPACRNALAKMCSWRRPLYVCYLGTVASWTSSRASWNFSPDRTSDRSGASAPASLDSQPQVLEPRRRKEIPVVPKRLLVLSGLRSATDPARRTGGIGDAA